jgi:hypothetical protein
MPHHFKEEAAMLPDLQMHDVVRLRKPHPCGSTDWLVIRLGADIRLKCLGCGRLILLSRRDVAKRLKRVLPEEERSDGLPGG